MEIYLRVEKDGDFLADLEVRVEQSHTVGDIAAAIVDFLGLNPEDGEMLSRESTGPMGHAWTVAEAGILSGDTIVLGRRFPKQGRRPDELQLVVTSGPDAGKLLPLAPGQYVIGRDAMCDFVLTDPQVSRQHLRLTVDPAGRLVIDVLVTDRNEVRTDGHVVLESEPVRPEQVIRLGASSLTVRNEPLLQTTRVDAFGNVPFHRTPYFAAPVQEVVVSAIKDVPSEPEKTRFAYLSALMPIVMGVAMYMIFGHLRFLLFIAFSPMMVIGNYFEQRRRSGKKFKESVERFNQMLVEKASEVRTAIANERQRRFAASPDIAALNGRAAKRSVDLWVRDRNAYDFLSLRVGMGDMDAALTVEYSDSGDVEFRDQVDEALGETKTVSDVPLVVNLTELGVIGLVGRAGETSAMASALAVQAACLHSPEDLVIFGGLNPARQILEWLKWSPHTRSSSSPYGGRHLVGSKEETDAMIGELVREAARRLESKSDSVRFPWLLVFLDRAVEPDAAIVSRLLDTCPASGISVVWMTDTRERVPRQAKAVIDCQSPMTGQMSMISYTDPDLDDLAFDSERVSSDYAGETCRWLAPLRDASSANAATAIPRVVPLFTAFGIEAVDSDWVARQWKTDRGYSLQGPIGYTDAGPMVLDMVEHGPHGLIGGTSGAGKSELVMSIVASLIAFNPPTRINFLFIDYKGGASSDLFKDVPHTVGYVTNLDGLLSMRALTSLRAELNRRMSLMQGKAKDLAEMIEKYPDEAPPSLVIVVDEFATLVKEIPDFVAGVVDIAQRGRSLGIHLILATQRPSGSINDNIKANTNLRISLRMLDTSESGAVIGTPDAAGIPAPLKGRGFARMGPGDLVAFQSAWAGAPLLSASGPPPVGVDPFAPTALPQSAGMAALARAALSATKSEPEGPTSTQVAALLTAIVETTQRLGHKRGRPPWLEVLPPVISIEQILSDVSASGVESEPGVKIAFGMVDDPGAQAQYPAVIDMARSGGLIMHGTGGSGKSTVLKTIAVSAALEDSAMGGGHLTIFGLDFASRELGGLNRLPQCGGIASADDIEAATRIISLLSNEFERRRQALAESVAKAEAAPAETTVLFVIDGMETITELFDQSPAAIGLQRFSGMLNKLLIDGRQVGIHPVVSSSRRAGIKANVASALSDRLVLRQAEPHGYTDAGVALADAKNIELDPGQAFYNGPSMVQVAMLTPPDLQGDEDEQERQRLEREYLVQVAEGLQGSVDPFLVTAPLPRTLGLLPSDDPAKPVVGMADLTNKPVELDLTYNDVNLIGDPRSGKSTAMMTIGRQVLNAGGEVWVLASPSSALTNLDGAQRTCFDDGAERVEFINSLAEVVSEPLPGNPVLLIDDYDLFPEDRQLCGALTGVMAKVRYVAATSKPRGYSSHPLAQEARKARTLVYLHPLDGRDAQEMLGVPVVWHPGLPMVVGRGYVSVDRQPIMTQFSDPLAPIES